MSLCPGNAAPDSGTVVLPPPRRRPASRYTGRFGPGVSGGILLVTSPYGGYKSPVLPGSFRDDGGRKRGDPMEMIPVSPRRRGVRALGNVGVAIRLALVAFALLLGAQPVQAGVPCGSAPTTACGVGFCPTGSVCRLQGDTCSCLEECGDFNACNSSDCPAGFVCTNIGTAPCVCVPLPTATPTITPTATPTSPPAVEPVPAASTNGLLIALLALAAVGAVALAGRSRRSSAD